MVARGARGPFGQNPVGLLILIFLAYALLSGGVRSPIGPLVRNPTSPAVWISFIAFVLAIGVGITLHEFMHAYVAHRMGDDTGRLLGRLSLDPRAHLDLFGSLLIVLVGFGYGRPVPINEARMSNGRLGVALVSLAGPFTNFAIAAVAALPLRAGSAEVLGEAYFQILVSLVAYNALLGVFNLIPIPPLDGSKIVYGLLPARQAWTWRSYEQYGPLIFIALLFFGLLTPLVVPPAAAIANTLSGMRIF